MIVRSIVKFGVAAFIVLVLIIFGYTLENWGDSMHWAVQPFIENVYRFSGLGLVAFFVASLALNRWRVQHLTKEWGELVKFLSQKDNAQFMDLNNAKDYKNSFDNIKPVRYEMVARLCLAFLDDMYHLKSSANVEDWYIGSLELFAGRHWQWYTDNLDSYSAEFQQFLEERVPAEKRNI